jgi:hypothetical protein
MEALVKTHFDTSGNLVIRIPGTLLKHRMHAASNSSKNAKRSPRAPNGAADPLDHIVGVGSSDVRTGSSGHDSDLYGRKVVSKSSLIRAHGLRSPTKGT